MLKPSGAGIWTKCSGMGLLAAQLPKIEHDNTSANEGSCAHKVAENMFRGTPSVIGDLHFDVPVSQDIIDNVKGYHKLVHNMGNAYTACELSLDCSEILKGMKGSADNVVIDGDGILHIFDLKYGFRYVEVVENKQLLIYAGAAYDLLHMKHDIKGIELHIYQPRNYDGVDAHRSWKFDVLELHEWTGFLQDAVKRVFSDHPVFSTGDHCRYCPGRYACKALLETSTVDVEMIMSYSHAVDMNAEQIALALDLFESAKATLKNITTGLEEALIHKIKNGEHNQRYEYVRSLGNAAWTIPVDEIDTLGNAYNAVLCTQKPITPAQAKKAGVPKEIVDTFTERPQRGLKLKRIKGFKK